MRRESNGWTWEYPWYYPGQRGEWKRKILRALHPSLASLEPRPWPLPERPWTWRQTWQDLLFAPWPNEADRLRP